MPGKGSSPRRNRGSVPPALGRTNAYGSEGPESGQRKGRKSASMFIRRQVDSMARLLSNEAIGTCDGCGESLLVPTGTRCYSFECRMCGRIFCQESGCRWQHACTEGGVVGGEAEAAASGERGGGVGGAEVLSEDGRHQAAGGQERRGMEVEEESPSGSLESQLERTVGERGEEEMR